MLQMDTVIRSIAAKTKVSSAHIQSAEGNTVTDEEIDTYIKTAESLAEYPIYYVDESGTVADMRNTIVNFVLQRDLKEREVSLVITIDHITLTKGRDSDMEKKVIDELYKMLLDMKRLLMAQGIRCLFICLSQLNRDIQSVERKKPAYHYPTSNDLFGASSIYQGSDYVLITHNPSTISGIQSYGPPCGDKYPEGLPLYCNKTGRAMIYWHLIKNRFGKLAVMIMRENFLESKIEDMETE